MGKHGQGQLEGQKELSLKQSSNDLQFDFDNETTTVGDVSVVSEEHSPRLVAQQIIAADQSVFGPVLLQITVNSPKGPLEIKIRQGYNLHQVAAETCAKGGFCVPEMAESLATYFKRLLQEAFFDPVPLYDPLQSKPFYPTRAPAINQVQNQS